MTEKSSNIRISFEQFVSTKEIYFILSLLIHYVKREIAKIVGIFLKNEFFISNLHIGQKL